ncbi:hypothetical protein Tco_0658577 [Tanacetum coccineum]
MEEKANLGFVINELSVVSTASDDNYSPGGMRIRWEAVEWGYGNGLFPGIGLSNLLSGARIISDGMLQAATEWGYRTFIEAPPKVKRTGALLERVFMPCDMYFRYTRHKVGRTDLKVLTGIFYQDHMISSVISCSSPHLENSKLRNFGLHVEKSAGVLGNLGKKDNLRALCEEYVSEALI